MQIYRCLCVTVVVKPYFKLIHAPSISEVFCKASPTQTFLFFLDAREIMDNRCSSNSLYCTEKERNTASNSNQESGNDSDLYLNHGTYYHD